VRIRKEGDKYIASYRDLNTQWATPGWLLFEMAYDEIITCCGWKYIKPDMFDSCIQIGKDGQVHQILLLLFVLRIINPFINQVNQGRMPLSLPLTFLEFEPTRACANSE